MIYNVLNIRKKLYILILLVASFTLFSLDSYAQNKSSSKKKKTSKKESDYKLMEHLWFGGGLTLQFGSSILGNGSLSGNVFNVGVSPMAGYKLTNWLSFGPRFEFSYYTGRYAGGSDIYKLSITNYSFGVFNRMKFFRTFFSHIEFARNSDFYWTGFFDANNKFVLERDWSNHLYTGLGYNSGGDFGYEFYVMYDFLAPDDVANLPIVYRVGFTYKF
ncbi:MAG: hypothetical protein IPH93_09580 [Saprospiraceae bacterium]|nr:hypothetical protein [Saprospiraceae bacterium]MBK9632468.1 hypothetical protein [Saprospiraceae bacterium]